MVSKERYAKMVRGSFHSLADVLALFPTSVVDVENRVTLALDEAKKDIASIIGLTPVDRTFDNTARALDEAQARFGVTQNVLWAIKSVHPDESLRDACQASMLRLQNFAIDSFLHVDLYHVFKSYVDGNAKSEILNSEQQYFLQESMKDFRRAGLHVSPDELVLVKKLQKELAELGLRFSTNVAVDKSSISVSRDELSGVSDHFIKTLNLDSSGKHVVRCDYPSVAEVGKHCSVESTRRLLSRAFGNRAYPANKSILESIISKRHELANLLGFETYAHFDLDNQMAKNPSVGKKFIEDLARRVEQKELSEFALLSDELPIGVSLVDGKFKSWDFGYVNQQYKKKHFAVDDREIAEYFTMEKTIAGIFDIYQKFLGLDFVLVEGPEGIWHDDASVIEVRKSGSDSIVGYIFLDLYPRDNKYAHACCGSIMSPLKARDGLGEVPSVAVVIANFPKSTPDRPSLLKHSDVTTFFHEFGHAMHNLLGRVEMPSFAGYNTKTDFVEVPSQMFEEWMWDKGVLRAISAHYKTGEPLSDELIDKMLALKKFDSGYFVQRQCFYALLSFAYFSGPSGDLDYINRSLYEHVIKHIAFDDQMHGYASFGHLTGYGAKYYSYLWSKVFALDLFDTIRTHGLLNEEIGHTLIRTVLGRGGSVEPDILLHDFLGRESNQDAFLRDLGLDS